MENNFIVGDSTLFAKGLNLVLTNFGFLAIEQIAFENINTLKIGVNKEGNIFWIDGAYNSKTALSICQSKLKKLANSKTFIFCNSHDPHLIKSFLLAGISGYFLPDCSPKCIKEALFQVSIGNKYIDPMLSQILSQNMLGLESKRAGHNPLTKREKQILNLIVEENTTQEIANKLFISFCTVETHRLHLIQKLGVRNTAGLVREAVTQNIYEKSMNSMSF
ncbi:LuxR C-terminal-related transcriptional regulator [Aquiflexum sp.]|uniref:LuxR C-terminal-related transcriptional regulator n=1 Tax=Aquiflexum sp. TaxID=1872584 RepID=UPI003593388E